MNTYAITVITSNIKEAGTDAKVHIELIGKYGTSGKIPLARNSKFNENSFERGQRDEYDIKCQDLGSIRAVKIGHDNRGVGAAWHLQEVVVESKLDGRQWLCQCNRWLAKEREDGKTERELVAEEITPGKKKKHTSRYEDVLDEQPSFDDRPHRRMKDLDFSPRDREFEFDARSSRRSSRSSSKENRLLDDDLDFYAGRKSPRSPLERIDRLREKKFDDPHEFRALVYKVTVSTTKKFGAGTDAKVFIKIYGEKGDSERLPLTNSKTHKNTFESGNVDVFDVTLPDIGAIRKIKIGHDNTGAGPGWHLKDVRIETPFGDFYTFPCDKWLDSKEDDGKIERTLYPDESSSRVVDDRRSRESSRDRSRGGIETRERINDELMYLVHVETSNLAQAGTDAHVYIQIYGETYKTDKITLEKSQLVSKNKNVFEKGQKDSFRLVLPDLREIKKIKIGHDNAGMGPGWHLKDVRIETPHGHVYYFPCNRWLDKHEDDKKIERTLYPELEHQIYDAERERDTERRRERSRELSRESSRDRLNDDFDFDNDAQPGNEIYTINVTTSDLPNAGTDSKVYIKMYGANYKTDNLTLKKSETHKNPFEKGHTDVFKLELPTLGEIRKIKIGHDNSGIGPGWHLQDVKIKTSHKQVYYFPCHKWLDKKEDDKKIERTLYAEVLNEDLARSPRASIQEIPARLDGPAREELYVVHVETSNKAKAGTDAKVFLQIYGERIRTDKLQLKKSETHKNPFEKGHTDVFKLFLPNLGRIEKIVIGHDNSGSGPGWHLKDIKIETPQKQVYHFPCDRWLDKHEDDKKIERILYPELGKDGDLPQNVMYRVSVDTSDIPQAGTDAKVYIKMYGRELKTERLPLSKSLTHKNPFEKGHTDVFELNAPDLGEIEKIKIGHDNSGIGPAWHLNQVKIELSNGKVFVFPCNKWLDKSNAQDGRIERELFSKKLLMEDSKNLEQFIGKILDYEIVVRTSDIVKAGTNANVYIKIYGEARKSEQFLLTKSSTHMNKFERGRTDRFNVKEEYFGDIRKIKIGHDGHGPSPGWHLAEVVIECADLGRKWTFPCNRWLAKDEGDGQLEVELKPLSGMDDIINEKQYLVEVLTGDVARAGTNANVFLTMFGENAKSAEIHLAHSETHANKFERNHRDKFHIEAPDLGYLQAIRIRHDNAGIVPDWFLSRVEITDISASKKYIFNCDRWFAVDRDDGKIDRIIREANYKPKGRGQTMRRKKKIIKQVKGKKQEEIIMVDIEKPYYVKIYTGDKQSPAGCDVNVWIKLFGDNQVTNDIKLSTTDRINFNVNKSITNPVKFLPNQIDLFTIDAPEDLGTLYAIQLKFEDCLRMSNDLHLLKVEVYDDSVNYVFEYDKFVSVKDLPASQRFKKLVLLERDAEF